MNPTTVAPEATYAPTSPYDYISPQALMNIGNALPSHGTPQEQQVVNNVNTALQSEQLKQGISNYFNARYPQMGLRMGIRMCWVKDWERDWLKG